jgi:hypothetical protein
VILSLLVVSGCASSGKKPATSVKVLPPANSSGVLALNHDVQPARASQVARASNRLFAIFPAVPGKRRCAISEAGPSPRHIPGTCQTTVRLNPVTQAPEWFVTFAERWRIPACAPDLDVACPHPWRLHVWRITEVGSIPTDAKLQVDSIRSSGATAPQDYK